MSTPVQFAWSGSSGLYVIPRNVEGTPKPFTPVELTAGTITYAYTAPSPPIVPAAEEEWASLLATERKSLAQRRVKPGAVNKAVKQVRYRR